MSANSCWTIDPITGQLVQTKGSGSSGGSGSDEIFMNRNKKVLANTWLLMYTKPSSVRGKYIDSNKTIVGVNMTCSKLSTFDLEIYSHEGNLLNLTLIDTVSFTNTVQDSALINQAVASGVQVAIRLVNGVGRDVLVGMILE